MRLATRPSRMVIARVAGPEGKVIAMAQKANSLAHTKWLCKYRIVSTPKYRRKAVCNQYRRDPGEILGRLCQWRGVEIIEGHPMPDRVRMLVSIPPEIAVSSSMGYLKGKSSLMMFDRHANLKYRFGNRRFWAEGYHVSTVGLNGATIAKHIREQESADIALDRLGVKEYEDPFKRRCRGPFDGPATRQGAIGPERSSGRGLESLAWDPWGYTLRANHPLCGWS